MSELFADKPHLLEAVPRIRWTFTSRLDVTLADCRALPVDWNSEDSVVSLYCWFRVEKHARPVDGILFPGSAKTSKYADVILARREWTAVPSNESMPAEEPILAWATYMQVPQYAIVDWASSDIIMLKAGGHLRKRLETDKSLGFDTILMRYCGAFQLPRPFTVTEHVRLMWSLMPYRITWIVACLRAGFRREALLTRAREMAYRS
jgi:hypothetical protein